MAMADLITQLKQDFDDVYAAGKAAGGGSGDYDKGYEDGKNSVVDIARTLKSARFQNLNLFGKTEVELNFDVWESNFQNLFQIISETNRNVTCEHITINCPYTTINSLNQMFYCQYPYTDETLKRLTLNFDTQKCVNYLNAFTQMRALEIIDGTPLDFSSVTSASNTNAFPNCVSLKEVRFVPNSIKVSIKFANSNLLSTDTIQSIIDGLADLTPRYYEAESTGIGPDNYKKGALIENIISVTEYGKDDNGETLYNVEYGTALPNIYNTIAYKEGGGTAQTLTLHATVGAKLTAEQKATITAKNWELVY